MLTVAVTVTVTEVIKTETQTNSTSGLSILCAEGSNRMKGYWGVSVSLRKGVCVSLSAHSYTTLHYPTRAESHEPIDALCRGLHSMPPLYFLYFHFCHF